MQADLQWEIVDNTRFIERSLIDAVRNNHRAIMDKICALAKERAPVDTGALKAIIHVVGPWGSGYNQAKEDALQAPGTRIEIRDQINDPLVLEKSPDPGVWLAAIDIPLTYIIWVHHGYYSILAQRIMPSNPFVSTAFYELFPEFMEMCAKDFKQILK